METTLREQFDWLEQARRAVFCRDDNRPGMDSRFPGGSRLPRTGLLDRAMAAHSSPTGRRRSPASAGPAPTLECASDASAVLPASLLVTAGPPAFPTRFPAPSSTRAFGCLQPFACRLVRWAGASQPPERSRSPNGAVCQPVLPMPPWRGPALGSASSSRYRVWPLPPVPGERQTLTNP